MFPCNGMRQHELKRPWHVELTKIYVWYAPTSFDQLHWSKSAAVLRDMR